MPPQPTPSKPKQPAVDLDALAKQFGGQSAPAAKGVDLDALAQQFGGASVAAPSLGAMRQMERDTATMQAKVQQPSLQYIPTGMGVAPPSNLMLTQGGLYAPNPNAGTESLEGLIGSLNYALGPYVAAGAGGAAAGAPFGGVTAIPGAGLGVLSLGITDLLGGAYNAIAPQFGGPRLTTPSELIRNTMVQANLAKVPQTPGERIVYSGANTAASALPAQQAMNIVGGALKNAPGLIGATGQVLAKPVLPAVTAVSSGAGGLASQAATELGADPNLAAGIGVLGSLSTGTLGAPKMPATVAPRTAAQLKALEKSEYDIAHGQGVEFLPAQVDILADQSIRDAVNPNHPQGPVSAAAIPAPITDILRQMKDFAADKGRLDSRDLDTFRQNIGATLRQLGGQEKLVGTRILENIDKYTSDPSLTLNAIRSNTSRLRATYNDQVKAADAARDKVRQADKDLAAAEAAYKANPTILANARNRVNARAQQQAAQQASDEAEAQLQDVYSQYSTASNSMRQVDPDMVEVNARVNETRAAYNAADSYIQRDKALNAIIDDASVKLTAAQRELDSWESITSGGPYKGSNYANAKKLVDNLKVELQKLNAEKAALTPFVTRAKADISALQDDMMRAVDKQTKRMEQLSAADDITKRMSERNAALEAGRKLHPVRLRTEAMEDIPEAAGRTETAVSGNLSRALRNEVRAYVKRMGDDFDRLPPQTQAAFNKFIKGGNVNRYLLEQIGRLAPGGNLGNLFTLALGALGSGGSNAITGFLTALGGAVGTQAARGIANTQALKSFNRLRDIVSMGAGAPQPVPRSDVQNMLAYLLAQGTQQEPPR